MKSWFLIVLFLFVGLTVNAQTSDLEQQDVQRQYEILFHEAMLQRQRGRHDATFDLLSRCLELKPDASEVCFFLAQYYTEIKNTDKALELFKKATVLSPNNMTYMELSTHPGYMEEFVASCFIPHTDATLFD